MFVSKALPKIDFTVLHRNMVIILHTTVCDANNESETNVVIRINACKKIFTCPCLCPFPCCWYHFWYFFCNPGHGTSWSGLFWEVGTHYSLQVNPSTASHFRFKLSEKIYTVTLGIAHLILYLIYSGSTSFTWWGIWYSAYTTNWLERSSFQISIQFLI